MKKLPIDENSLEVDGIDTADYPDFSDAYFSYGEYEDGTKLSDSELDELSATNPDLLYDTITDQLS